LRDVCLQRARKLNKRIHQQLKARLSSARRATAEEGEGSDVQQEGPVDHDQPHDVEPNSDDKTEEDDDEVQSEEDTEQEDDDDEEPPLPHADDDDEPPPVQYVDDDVAQEHDGETIHAHPAPTELPDYFSFNITSTDFKGFVGGGKSRGLVGGWTAFMYQQFHTVYPSCALAFYYNHCRQRHPQKSNTPYTGSAEQDVVQATVSMRLYVQDEPAADRDVRVDVEVTGVCHHVADELVVERPNRRQLRADQRAESADLLTSSHAAVSDRAILWNLGKPSKIRPTVSSRQNIPAV